MIVKKGNPFSGGVWNTKKTKCLRRNDLSSRFPCFKQYVTRPASRYEPQSDGRVGHGNRVAELHARLAPLPLAHAIRSATTAVSQPFLAHTSKNLELVYMF